MTDQELLKEIRDRFKEAYDAAEQEYSYAIDDLNFVNGDQWPASLKSERAADERPCLVISKIPVFADQIIGDIRQNEPSIKVLPVDSKADVKTAEIFTGLIRNIEIQSDAETSYDTASESSVYCGYGAFRINTQYSDDSSFDQDIVIARIKNPFTIYWDPSAQKWDKSDARYCFITEKMPKEEFERLYPDASVMEFEGGKDRDPMWGMDKTIRVAEYWKKEPAKKTIYLMQDPGGNIFTTDIKPRMDLLQAQGWQILKDRTIDAHKLRWWKVNQHEILEGPTDWPGKYIPICMVYGKELNIEGRTAIRGVVRNSKDAQRLYNFSRSSHAEKVALSPKAPWLATAKMISNYQKIWNTANKKNWSVLPYDPDPSAPGMKPERTEPTGIDTVILTETQISDQEIHDTTGLQLASLGKKSNERSGRAILARQREGDVAQFAYYDNLGRALKYAGKVLIDLIPKIYDTARIVRIINPDNTPMNVPINQEFSMMVNNQEIRQIFDLTVGKYDVAVSIGPSYTTQRQESAENMLRFMEIVPQAAPLLADLFAKNMDWPGAQEIEKRLKLLLPPQLQGGDGAAPSPPAPSMPGILQARGAMADLMGKELDNKKKFFEARKAEFGEDENEQGTEKGT